MRKDAQTSPDGRGMDRRQFLSTSATVAVIVISGGALIHPREAWGLEAKGLKPETVRTLITMARDIYPHDKVADKFYAIAVKAYDEKAAADPAVKNTIESGVSDLDAQAMAAFKTSYIDVPWELQRVEMLRKIEATPFFQTIRAGLVVSLYNQKEIWPIFGYEGESASKGGYIHRGFNDITWL